MTDDQRADISTVVGDEIEVETSREKSVRYSHLSTLHPWWSRRPNVLARVAGYLAITEEQQPETELLTALGKVDVNPTALNEARSRVRDASWRWYVEENLARTTSTIAVSSMVPSAPKVLDPFAGAGSIPMEVSRLGCDVYAGDLNPIAYRILRASLEFPSKLIHRDSQYVGSGSDGTWDGLINELRHWATEMDGRVVASIRDMYPPNPQTGFLIDRYFWFLFVRCASPTCGVEYPAQPSLRVSSGSVGKSVSFMWQDGEMVRAALDQLEAQERRGFYCCPKCGTQVHSNSVDFGDRSWRLCLARNVSGRKFVPVSGEGQEELAPWSDRHEERLQSFLAQPETKALRGELPELYSRLKVKGVTSFDRLLSPRQLSLAAEYVRAIHDSIDDMRGRGLSELCVEALSTYLGLFIGHLVNRNSRLCSWNPVTVDSGATFQRPSATLPRVFIEIAPRGVLNRWLDSIEPAISSASEVAAPISVYQSNAAELRFEKDFFDAVVTDPPYYDAVPYSDLADFFWVWEQMIKCERVSVDFRPSGCALEILPATAPEGALALYRSGMLSAFKEVSRVLKPGRKFCLIFSGRVTDSFQQYIDLCHEAGMELVDVKRVPEKALAIAKSAATNTFLIYFRKPAGQFARDPLQTAQGAEIIDAAASGKSVLYAGLAELMAKHLSEADINDILPVGGKGAKIEQLMEVLADRDPREVLVECFGKAGLREIANELHSGDAQVISPIEVVLTHFGFSLPRIARPEGAPQVLQKVRRMTAKISQAASKEDMRGPFLEVSTAIERLLRLSIWGWAQLVFGADRDFSLRRILSEENPDRRYDLDRLTMGDVLLLFRRLPDAMAAAPKAKMIEQKLGRTHVYSTRKTKFVEGLERLVSLRNKVEHDKNGYWTNIDAASARGEYLQVLSEMERLLPTLVNVRAIPVIVEPIKEIRDKWNRRAYVLSRDDATEHEARFSSNLVLGGCYLYFGTETNPRPVDPLILGLDEIGNFA